MASRPTQHIVGHFRAIFPANQFTGAKVGSNQTKLQHNCNTETCLYANSYDCGTTITEYTLHKATPHAESPSPYFRQARQPNVIQVSIVQIKNRFKNQHW